ncbi:MAG: FHA domain-containing protein [Deltaproteobacteria bacterium]|nr:FHA domain-containing protein [Deltaproteobacteria bacterium]
MSGRRDKAGSGAPEPSEQDDLSDTDPSASAPESAASQSTRPLRAAPSSTADAPRHDAPMVDDAWSTSNPEIEGDAAPVEHTYIEPTPAATDRTGQDAPRLAKDAVAGVRSDSQPGFDVSAEVLNPVAVAEAPVADLDGIGPAFPDPEEAGPVVVRRDVDGAGGDARPAPARASEVPTSARPGLESVADAAMARAQNAGRLAADDGWADFKDGSGGWKSLSGESQLAPKPKALSGPQYTRRDTNVYKLGKAVKAEEGARLVGTAGKDTGREFAISEREIAIGRGPSNAVVLGDSSVSREHARLLHEGDNYILVDLRSANGTFVNGQRVDRARLRSGDEVGFGSSRFRFLEIGDVFKPVDASGAPVLPGAKAGVWLQLRQSPHFRSVLVSALILAFTLIVTAVILVVRANSSGGRPRRDTIFRYYLQGVEAFKRRQWSDAEAQFKIIVGLDPSHARGQQYLQELAREKELALQLQAARTSVQAGDLAQGYAQASGITDSVYTPEAAELLRGVDAELDLRVSRAKGALETSQPAVALKLLDGVESVRPGRPDVAALRDRARAATGAPAAPAPSPDKPEPAGRRTGGRTVDDDNRGAAKEADAGDDEPASPKRQGFGSGVTARATAAFASGDPALAMRILEAAADNRDVQVLKNKILRFQKVYDGAKEEHRAKRADAAIKELKQAKAFEAKITGGDSDLVEEIDRKIADMYYVQGMASYLAGRYPDAYRELKTALSFDSGHRPSQKKLDDLADKAKEIFDDGARAQASDVAKAKERFRLVLQIVSPATDTYRKARERLDALP